MRSSARPRPDRGFGDFWGYALVAEGAAEAMIEVGAEQLGTSAAPSIVVEEAGGQPDMYRQSRCAISVALNGTALRLKNGSILSRSGSRARASRARAFLPLAHG